ncbi:MAG: GntR family transcriptional regulator [Firmicutes bacterium]|nr:GntR family transcriptional regulator [Bacillota bacterium]
MAWHLDSNRPIYLQLQEELELRIISGYYPSGTQLPTVRDLAHEAAVNPNTMQRALQELERLELVFAHRTSGRFVTEDKEMIHQLRLRLAKEQVAAFLERIYKLGLTKEEALDLVR